MSLEISESVLIQSIEHSNLAHTISRLDGDMELIYVNQAFLDTTGYERDEVIGRNCRFLQGEGTSARTVDEIRKSLSGLQALDVEILNFKKDGTPFWNRLRMAPVFDGDRNPIAYMGVQSDVTHLREAQRFEQERQKLEALGRMTGNISHEIKNALQPIKLMSEVLRSWSDLEPDRIQRCIDILSENVAVADRSTQDVLRFSRRSGSEIEHIKTVGLGNDISSFVQNLVHGQIDFIERLEQPPKGSDPVVSIRLNHLYQIMMNLANNAIYAMQEKGVLTLEVSYRAIGSAEAVTLGMKRGIYFCISLQDTGVGMDEKTMRSVFDPFFSTKPPGEGTGLGLSISQRLVKEWGGAISVESKANKGSKFLLYIPTVL